MASEDWQRVRAAFEAVLDQPEASRLEYLETVYGDRPSLIAAVKELLLHYDEDTFADHEPSPTERPVEVFAPGKLVAGRFRIVRFLGSGGMGQVYEAEDERLRISLALKTLHPALARDSDWLERFRREVRVAREVAHPNLCRVFDLIEHSEAGQEINCFSMELLRGANLASYLRGKRPLGPREALGVFQPIASAVTGLHQRGLVHRDLKPSNVILSKDADSAARVVVTDFGLAKSLRTDERFFESRQESHAGSPYFMAPELWEGQRPTVASDIYSLGLILDEMVTKTSAFNTDSLPGIYYSKFREGPIPPRQRSEGLPEAWERAILRCLENEPARRYETVGQLLAELEGTGADERGRGSRVWTAGGEVAMRPVICVLPLSDLSQNKDQAYFCDGLTEELIHLLSQAQSLRVLARGSAFAGQQKYASIVDLGRELRATHVLQGTVRRVENRLRVTVQLVETQAGFNLWSRRFDREVVDLFAIQEEIAQSILDVLNNNVDGGGRADRPFAAQTANLDAYSWYLKGLFEFHQQTAAGIARAVEHFEKAIAADSRFAAAYVCLADCHCLSEWYGLKATSDALPAAQQHIKTALDLNASLAGAHCTMGMIRARYEWDWASAELAYKRALSLNSNLARAHFSYALDYLTPLRRPDEALDRVQYALQLDPLSPTMHTAVGGCLFRKRSYEAARKSLEDTLRLYPSFYHAHLSLARVLEQLGHYEDAAREYERAYHQNAENPGILAELGHCYGRMGKNDMASGVQGELRQISDQRCVSPFCSALVYLGLSQSSEAIDELSAAAEQRCGSMIWVGVDPRFDRLRGDLRFNKLLAKMGLN